MGNGGGRFSGDMMKIVDIVPVMEGQQATGLALKCKLCGELCAKFPIGTKKKEADLEMVGLRAHMDLIHRIQVGTHECGDPECLR